MDIEEQQTTLKVFTKNLKIQNEWMQNHYKVSPFVLPCKSSKELTVWEPSAE